VKPGDLVVLVLTEDEMNDTPPPGSEAFYELIGLHGVIIRPVTFDDGDPVNRWCDWWVLIDGELQPWAKENLEVIDD
jgi:hypothetical protein